MRCVYGGFSCSWGDRFKTVILINVVIGSAQIIRECCKSSWSIVKWVLSSCQNGRSFVELFFYAFRFRFKRKQFEIICRVEFGTLFSRSDSCNSPLALRNEISLCKNTRTDIWRRARCAARDRRTPICDEYGRGVASVETELVLALISPQLVDISITSQLNFLSGSDNRVTLLYGLLYLGAETRQQLWKWSPDTNAHGNAT